MEDAGSDAVQPTRARARPCARRNVSTACSGVITIGSFLEPRNGDVLIRATPKGPRPDPYAVGAVPLIALVDLGGGEQVDHSQLEPGASGNHSIL